MSQSVQVRSIETLGTFRASLLRYRHEATAALDGFEYFLGRALEWLRDRTLFWQKDVRRAQDELRFAEMALGRCRASGHTGPNGLYRAPDCGRYETALVRAGVRLRDAEGALQGAQHWQQTVERAIEGYRLEVRRLKDVLDENLPVALISLEAKLNTLAAYVSIALPSEPERAYASAKLAPVAAPDEGRNDAEPLAGHAEAVAS